ncbi:hypothetical protein AGMMS49942_23770 [Spirochaetia bacterium]|nr:hypothetical protein AGMMS49942_23770 [Spirochaetia bacterium]
MDEQKTSDRIGRVKAFDVGEQVIALNTALSRFFETEGYNKSAINGVLSSIETSKWIDGLYEWVCEGRPIEAIRLTDFVRELLSA